MSKRDREKKKFDAALSDLISVLHRSRLVWVCYCTLLLTATAFGEQIQTVATPLPDQNLSRINNVANAEDNIIHGSFHEALQHDILDHLQKHILVELNMKRPPSKDVLKRVPNLHLNRIIQEASSPTTTTAPFVAEGTLPSFNVSVVHVISEGPKRHSAHNSTLIMLGARLYQKILYASCDAPDRNFSPNLQRTYFHLVNMQEQDVKNATLYFFVQKPQLDAQSTNKFTVYIYRFIDGLQINDDPLITRTFNLDLKSGTWVSLNVTDLADEWIKSPSKNYGIMIKAHHQDTDVVNRTTDDSNRTPQIFLHIEFNEDTPRKVVQPYHEDPICSAHHPEERCCRYRLQVDFEAMGWDWIIAPKRYDAYYCAGSCPFNYKQSTPHTHLTQQMEQIEASSKPRTQRYRSLGPCCTPKEYQELKIIYITEAGTVHERKVPDMMVMRCGCA